MKNKRKTFAGIDHQYINVFMRKGTFSRTLPLLIGRFDQVFWLKTNMPLHILLERRVFFFQVEY